MIARKSPLELINFLLLELNYVFIPAKEENAPDWAEILNNYKIDIQFSHQKLEEDYFKVHAGIHVNIGKKTLPGFKLSANGICVFRLQNPSGLDENQVNNLRFFSSLNICINTLRNEFSIITAQSPIGR